MECKQNQRIHPAHVKRKEKKAKRLTTYTSHLIVYVLENDGAVLHVA